MPGLVGTTVDSYNIKDRLGHGGMSEVYLAYDERRQRDVAIKIVNSTHADYIERFRREAEAIAMLNHAHILPALDYGEQEFWHYMVMPHIAHGTLRERLAKGPLSLEEAGIILEQIGSALQYAHDQGIIHRDIKPSNILLRDDHYAYLGDFGLAKSLEGGSTITQTGNLLGTPEYMAPELSEGPATTSSDLYALGILLYQMVTGQVPFTGETPIAVYWKQLRDEPAPPSRINPAIPPAVEHVILRALDKDPTRRYQSADELVQAYINAITFPNQVEVDERPSSSYVTVAQEPGATPMGIPGHAPQQEDRLVLPNNPAAAPSAAPQRRRFPRRVVPRIARRRSSRLSSSTTPLLEPLTPVVLQDFVPVTPQEEPTARPRPRRRRPATATTSRRHRRNPVLLSVIGLIILLFIILLIALPFTYMASQASLRAAMATVTANANATGSAQAAEATATQGVQATATAGVASTATGGSPVFTDVLAGNTAGRWQENAGCAFIGGSYHVLVQQPNFLQICSGSGLSVDNAAVEVDVSLLSGNDAGLIFRVNGDQFYDFEITNLGEFFLRRHNAGSGANYTYLIQNTKSTAIRAGSNKNTLLIIASGDDFKLYINGFYVGETHDGQLASGQIGLVAGTLASSTGEASFANLKVFKP